MIRKSPLILYAVTFIVAFCSIVYELLLAQTLSVTMGGTMLRYNVTIGFYLASLGVGVLLVKKSDPAHMICRLFKTELILSILGALAPVLGLFIYSLAEKLFEPNGPGFTAALYVSNHLLIIAVGILSGVELPLLMHLGEECQPNGGNRILAVDYFGTLAGSLMFAFLLLPRLGIFGVGFFSGTLNAASALLLLLIFPKQAERKIGLTQKLCLATVLGCMAFALAKNSSCLEFLADRLYLAAKP